MIRWRRIVRWVRTRYFGWRPCPRCRCLRPMTCMQMPVVFEDEPPMFVNVSCDVCKWETGVVPTILTEDAVKKLGYRDFKDYAEKNLGDDRG